MRAIFIAVLLLTALAVRADEPPSPMLTVSQARVLLNVLNQAMLNIRGIDLPLYLDAVNALSAIAAERKVQ